MAHNFMYSDNQEKKRFGQKPETDGSCINKLIGIYQNKVAKLSESEKNGLGDYYRKVQDRGQDAYYWILDAIDLFSRKHHSKQEFRYFIGILKNWMQYGYGYAPSVETDEVVDFFEEVTNTKVQDELRKEFLTLFSSYGGVSVTRMVASLAKEDISQVYLLLLKNLLKDKYGEGKQTGFHPTYDYQQSHSDTLSSNLSNTTNAANVSENKSVASSPTAMTTETLSRPSLREMSLNLSPSQSMQQNIKLVHNEGTGFNVGDQLKDKLSNLFIQQDESKNESKSKIERKPPIFKNANQIQEEADIVEQYLKEQEVETRSGDIMSMLESLETPINRSKAHENMRRYMESNSNIIKGGKLGFYKLKSYK